MYREFFMHNPLMALPLGSLVIFITVFVSIVVRTARRRPELDQTLASMALNDEQEAHNGR